MKQAQELRKTNIIGYILYMWQVEDLIRANGFDMDLIGKNVLTSYNESDREDVMTWWENLVEMMTNEGIEKKGHLRIVTILLNDVYNFHLELLTKNSEIAYQNAFRVAYSDIEAFESKLPEGVKIHHIELALSAIYGVFIMKLKGVDISPDTEKAIQRISRFLSILSIKYSEAERA